MSLRKYATNTKKIASEVAMSSRTRFILVEGETDRLFLSPHVGRRAVIRELDGRSKVCEVFKVLEQRRQTNFVAVIDADFDQVVGINPSTPRIAYMALSDDGRECTIDLEAMLICTRALRQMCGDCLGTRIKDHGGPEVFAEEMRESLRRAAAAVGSYRAAVMDLYMETKAAQGIGELDEEEWSQFVDPVTGAVSRDRLEEVIRAKVLNESKFREVRQRSRDFYDNHGAGWLLCRGHDMTELLAMRLSFLRGREIQRQEVERLLRDAYTENLLKKTAFGRRLEQFL